MQEAEIKKYIKSNLDKCARCALCVQNCPIYDIKKDENLTCRGLVCKLSGYENNQLSEKEVKNELKVCLSCSKCKSNCPSGVDTTFIFGYKNAVLNPSKISQRIFLIIKLLPLKMFYFLNCFKKTFIKTPDTNILYFKGCISKAQHKITYLDKIFKNPDFSCCGLPYLSGGDLKNYEKSKKRNIELIKCANTVVFDCASCKSAVDEYSELSKDDKKKLVFFSEFLKEKKYKIKDSSKYKNKTITFHKPCHLKNDDFSDIENFLSNIKGINYTPLKNPDLCCGFGGSYFMFHPVISSEIALKKAKEIKLSNADLVLSVCPSCVMGLRYNQIISLNFKKTLELRDFINNELIEINNH